MNGYKLYKRTPLMITCHAFHFLSLESDAQTVLLKLRGKVGRVVMFSIVSCDTIEASLERKEDDRPRNLTESSFSVVHD